MSPCLKLPWRSRGSRRWRPASCERRAWWPRHTWPRSRSGPSCLPESPGWETRGLRWCTPHWGRGDPKRAGRDTDEIRYRDSNTAAILYYLCLVDSTNSFVVMQEKSMLPLCQCESEWRSYIDCHLEFVYHSDTSRISVAVYHQPRRQWKENADSMCAQWINRHFPNRYYKVKNDIWWLTKRPSSSKEASVTRRLLPVDRSCFSWREVELFNEENPVMQQKTREEQQCWGKQPAVRHVWSGSDKQWTTCRPLQPGFPVQTHGNH